VYYKRLLEKMLPDIILVSLGLNLFFVGHWGMWVKILDLWTL